MTPGERELKAAWVQAGAAVVQAAAAVLLLWATWNLVGITKDYASTSNKMLKAQIVPTVGMELVPGQAALAIGNDGIDPVVDLSLDFDTVVFLAGPPTRPPVLNIANPKRMPGSPARGWWNLDRLLPGASHTVSIEEPAQNAIEGLKMMERSKAQGGIPGVARQEKVQLRALPVQIDPPSRGGQATGHRREEGGRDGRSNREDPRLGCRSAPQFLRGRARDCLREEVAGKV